MSDRATIVHLLRHRAETAGDRLAFTFLVEGDVEERLTRLTYAEIDAHARAVAAQLQQAGAGGGRVVLLLPPGLDFVAAFLGCLYAGAVAVPALPPRRRGAGERLRSILGDARPRAVLSNADLAPVLESLAEEMPELRAVRRLNVDAPGAAEAGAWREPALAASDLAFLQYTSGSTAAPKGVRVTHGNLLANEELIRRAFGQSADDVVVGWLPLHHDMGLIGNVLQPLYTGAQCHLMSPLAFLQRPARWLEAVSRLRATTSGGPNFAYELCLRKVTAAEREGLDLSSWRVAFNGAEPVRAETLRRFAAEFAPCGFRPEAFHPCYGLAEATLLVSCGPGGGARVRALSAAALEEGKTEDAAPDDRKRELVGCGAPLQTVLVVAPQTCVPCPAGRVGEVWVAGPSVPAGYWERPDETAETFGAFLADGSGPFLRTGDLGFLSEDGPAGELFLTGRIKDLIILRGRNHYPQDLELTAERSHPDLRPGGGAAFSIEAAAETGDEERLVLVHELVRHPRAGIEEIAAAVRRAVAEEHGVTAAEVVFLRPETLPRTTSGKVRRRACHDAWLAGTLGAVGKSTRSVIGIAAAGSEDGGWTAEIDRTALAGLGPAGRRQALESFVRQRAAGVLGLPLAEVTADRPLTALGLDSLSAVELKAGVEAALGVELPFADLLGGLSAAAVAARLADHTNHTDKHGQTQTGTDQVDPVPVRLCPSVLVRVPDPEAPLSAGQKALWFLHRLAPASAAYNLAGAARVPADSIDRLDPVALRRALQALVDRHDALRATFSPGSGGPAQRIHARVEVAFTCESAEGWSDEALHRRVHDEAFRPFDLEHGPLLRAALLTRPDGGVFVLAVHHIAADFWSLAVLARELGTLYDHFSSGPPLNDPDDPGLPVLELRFADWARWQEQALAGAWGTRLWEGWRDRLAGVPPLDLPTDRPRPPAQTFRGSVRTVRLGPGLARGLQALARREGSTLFTALLTGYAALLARWSLQDDFVIGSPTAGRMQDRFGSRLAGLVGYFVNPVPLRADLSNDPTAGDLLLRLRGTVLDAFERQDFPFPLLAERLHPQRDAGRPPLVQAMLTLQKAAEPDLQALAAFALGEPGVRFDLGGLHLESLALETPAVPLDVTLMAAELDGDLLASLQFNTDLFDAATAERLLGHLGNLLAGLASDLVSDPGRRVSELPLLSASERAELSAWNATAVAYDLERPLHVWIEDAAARTPEAIAVEGEAERLTYRELMDRSGRLARHLRDLGVAPGELVGVSAERSPEMVVGLLAVLRAGAAYVPLDPDYPAERLAFMQEDSGVRVLLTQERLREELPAGTAGRVPLDPFDLFDPFDPVDPASAAYMIYTSGSTGRPKGAVNTHRGIVNRLLWMQETFALTPTDRVLQKTPVSFDVSVWELFWPLMTGARLVLARPGGHQDPTYLARRIQSTGATVAHFVPSMLQVFLDEPEAAGCASLRLVIASGEALSGALARRFREVFPVSEGRSGAELHNLYGPTEAAVDVTWWPASAEEGARPVPIGRPVANTRIVLCDRQGREVPVGVPGELCIGGVQLAHGYWRRPDLTAERFVPDGGGAPGERLYRTGDLARRLADGAIEYAGRLDHQVKLRGVRIELGEIEAALTACPEVREAVVGARGQGTALRLVAWVTPAPGREITASAIPALRTALRRSLPEVMVPSAIVVLPALPLSPNGKVDRKALPDPDPAGGGRSGAATPYVAPRTPAEETLVAIWQDLLKVERVGVDDHFFDLGGHSLLATQLISRVRETFGVDIPLAALFEEAPTVANLARAVARDQVSLADEDDIISALMDLEGLSDEEVRALLESEEG
jgi:amino acid adenylation domain-containing protein